MSKGIIKGKNTVSFIFKMSNIGTFQHFPPPRTTHSVPFSTCLQENVWGAVERAGLNPALLGGYF